LWHPTTKFLVELEALSACATYTRREERDEVAKPDRLGARETARSQQVRKCRSDPGFLDSEKYAIYYLNHHKYLM
jgi:hypothetical protein